MAPLGDAAVASREKLGEPLLPDAAPRSSLCGGKALTLLSLILGLGLAMRLSLMPGISGGDDESTITMASFLRPSAVASRGLPMAPRGLPLSPATSHRLPSSPVTSRRLPLPPSASREPLGAQRATLMPFNALRRAALGGARDFRSFSAAGPVVFSVADIEANAFVPESHKLAFMFPGQGAQSLGMGVDLVEKVPKAKELFDKASKILGYDLLEVCRDGPKEKLDSTAVSQPAIFVTSMAAVEMLKMEKGDGIVDEATVTMGLSLGEYSALCFAGAISFEDGVKLVQERGAAMQAAADASKSGMASIIGLDSEKVGDLCKAAAEKSGKPVQIANYLCSGNYAVSGASEAIDTVMEIAKPEFKARMAVKLAVAGAFHTEFMQSAVERLKAVLETTEVKEPRIPVVSNFDGKAHKDPAVIKEILTLQVTSPVKWEDTMAQMLANDFESAYELGPGKVLAGIMKRFDKKAVVTNVGER